MTDGSNIVLRWKIDNATARLATGKMESEEFNEGGFRWTAVAEKRNSVPDDLTDFSLQCDMDHNGPWKCEAEVEVYALRAVGRQIYDFNKKEGFFFNETIRSYQRTNTLRWKTMNHVYKLNDTITLEFHVHIVSSERGEPIADPAIFAAPNRMSNVILKIGGEKLHVSKEILAIYSPVFETLFFGDFVEKGKEEVELKDVVYEEFLDLVHVIYLGIAKITDHTTHHLLKFADEFQMERVLELLKDHLIQSKGFDVVKKLVFADQYRLASLRDHCIQSFTSVHDMKLKLTSSPEFANFSDDMKARICERVMLLNLQMADSYNIVLRWKIDNANARLATGKMESEVFDEGGFRWTVGAEKRSEVPDDLTDFSLRCDVDHNGPWKCEAEVEVHVQKAVGSVVFDFNKKEGFFFNEKCRSYQRTSHLWWKTMNHGAYKINDTITLEFHVRIISSERSEPIADPAIFAAPNRMSNVILKIGGEKLHVSKEILAIYSPVFETLFFGDFAEKGKEEVELNDVVYEEFLDLVHVIYLGTRKITDHTVPHLLKLADQFQMERVLDLLKHHLTQSKGVDVMKKLLLADAYRLVSVRDHCLQSFTGTNDVKQKLTSSPEFDDFSDVMKAKIRERMLKLNQHCSFHRMDNIISDSVFARERVLLICAAVALSCVFIIILVMP